MRVVLPLFVSLAVLACGPADKADADDTDATDETDGTSDSDDTTDTTDTDDTTDSDDDDTDAADTDAASLCAPAGMPDVVRVVDVAVSTAGSPLTEEGVQAKVATLVVNTSGGFSPSAESSHWVVLEFDRAISLPVWGGVISMGYDDLDLNAGATGVIDGAAAAAAGLNKGQLANVIPPIDGRRAWVGAPEGTSFRCVGIGWSEGASEGENAPNVGGDVTIKVSCPSTETCDGDLIVVAP